MNGEFVTNKEKPNTLSLQRIREISGKSSREIELALRYGDLIDQSPEQVYSWVTFNRRLTASGETRSRLNRVSHTRVRKRY